MAALKFGERLQYHLQHQLIVQKRGRPRDHCMLMSPMFPLLKFVQQQQALYVAYETSYLHPSPTYSDSRSVVPCVDELQIAFHSPSDPPSFVALTSRHKIVSSVIQAQPHLASSLPKRQAPKLHHEHTKARATSHHSLPASLLAPPKACTTLSNPCTSSAATRLPAPATASPPRPLASTPLLSNARFDCVLM